MNQARSEQKKVTLKQSENNPSVVSTLPYVAHLADGEFSLHRLSAGVPSWLSLTYCIPDIHSGPYPRWIRNRHFNILLIQCPLGLSAPRSFIEAEAQSIFTSL